MQNTNLYLESTPNPNAMKFVASRMLIEGTSLDFTSGGQTRNAPLATALFNFPFVCGVFISANFITVTKSAAVDWLDINSELREFVLNYLNSGKPVLSDKIATEKANIVLDKEHEPAPVLSSELDIKISGILDEYIKPAVEGDGGAITFKSFDKGVVTVMLQGSCSGCPSSTVTLKAGIEALLKRMVPEVESVVAH